MSKPGLYHLFVKSKYEHHLVGGNFRLDALQAAVVATKMKHLERWSAKRMENAHKVRLSKRLSRSDFRI